MLLVTLSDPDAPPGGRELLYRVNQAALTDLFGEDLRIWRPSGARVGSAGGALKGHIDGIDRASLAELCALIAAERIDRVFLDGSNLGVAARTIKRRFPGVRVFSFFHNVEARFFLGSLKVRRNVHALAVLIANYVAERAAVRWSDVRIALSERDSRELRRLYGRGADAIAPMALADRLPPGMPRERSPDTAPYALMVGGAFYANLEGVRWYAREVARHVSLPVVVVGRGMEALAPDLAGTDRVRLVGTVDDLAPWYRDAAFVIAPIFDGSGMKTKVAEALMFGKHVVGTPESFSGYDEAVVAAGWQCADADTFTAAMGEARARSLPAFDPEMRALYERLYSLPAATRTMVAIIGADPVRRR